MLPVDARLQMEAAISCAGSTTSADEIQLVEQPRVPDSTFGWQTEKYDGVDLTVSARWTRRDARRRAEQRRTATANCAVIDHPRASAPERTRTSPGLLCGHAALPAAVKLNGVYPLPWDMQISGLFQSNPGIRFPPAMCDQRAGAAVARPPVVGGASTVTITNIFQPQTMFEHRINQLDMRLTKR